MAKLTTTNSVRRAGRLMALVAICLFLLWACSSGLAALAALHEGRPLDSRLLSVAAIGLDDLFIGVTALTLLGGECLVLGWKQSGLRRVLMKDDASTRTDVFYFVISITGLFTIIMTILTLGLGVLISRAIEGGFGIRIAAEWPLWVACPAVYLLQGFGLYWFHRLMHSPLFWPLHAVHHAAEDFNTITTARHHPIDSFMGAFPAAFLPAILGFSPEAIFYTMLFVTAWVTYIHTGLPSLPWLEPYVMGPRAHGIHHSADPRHFGSNFGGDFSIWDRLFGTYNMDAPELLTYGCPDPEGIYQSGRPLRDMILVQRVWLRGVGQGFRRGMRAIAGMVRRASEDKLSATAA